MTLTTPAPVACRITSAASRFLAGGKFAAFCLFALVFYQVFVAVMAFSPPVSSGLWADFIEDFRIRCFRGDPASGWMDMSSVWIMVSEPFALEAILLLFWWRPLRELWTSRRRAFLSTGSAAVILVAAIAISLLGLGRARPGNAAFAFPAERIRTALPMPSFALVDQNDVEITPEKLKGRVVLVTAVYASCTTACPMMLSNIRKALNELPAEDRAELVVVAISLNPEIDTRPVREMISRSYNFESKFHFLNGDPAQVNALLADLGVSRTRDEKTGEIVHSSLFMLLDRQGRIAYRLSASAAEQSWYASAVRGLVAEKGT